jgi:hypothetical protein
MLWMDFIHEGQTILNERYNSYISIITSVASVIGPSVTMSSLLSNPGFLEFI